jgi:uncharacterized protein YecE (DUF72 family)
MRRLSFGIVDAPGTGTLAVGTSGFAFPEWRGPFYPAELKDREMLAFYATRLGTVEINYTFRRFPSEKSLQGWLASTPPSFTFALKANQRITHLSRLTDVETARAFVERVAVLGSRLGPILVQCPPSLRFDADRLRRFLDGLPEGPRYAFEFRHASWEEAKPILASSGAAWVVTETDEAPFGGDGLGGARFAYLRLRRTEYGEDDLRTWAARAGDALRAGTDVFCYFKHEDGAAGPRFASRLLELTEG